MKSEHKKTIALWSAMILPTVIMATSRYVSWYMGEWIFGGVMMFVCIVAVSARLLRR
jgi:hypothetical protein